MKSLVTILLCIFFSYPLFGQDSLLHSFDNLQVSAKDSVVENQLVELALQNAESKISDLDVKAAKAQIGVAKAGWLSTISASSYWNEFTISPSSKSQFNYYYPKYNFGVSLPLSIFITVPKNVKIAKVQYRAAQEEEKLKLLELKSKVLSKYQDYLMFSKQLAIQSLVTENELNSFLQVERKFKSGTITIKDYNEAMDSYNTKLTRKLLIQHDLAVAKIELEQIIGTDLSNVIK
jgi:outer membrane protein TolC